VSVKQLGNQIAFFDEAGNMYTRSGREFNDRWDDDAEVAFTRPTEPATQKTVADAWEAFGGAWPYSRGCDFMGYSQALEHFFAYGFGYSFASAEHQVCTREQFEAYGREQEAKQEGEKWTHTYAGDKCYLLEPDKDADGYYAVKTDCGLFDFARENELTPIKPTITKAEAWDKATSQDVESSMSVGAILDEYEVK
jgi:hypothetical protein